MLLLTYTARLCAAFPALVPCVALAVIATSCGPDDSILPPAAETPQPSLSSESAKELGSPPASPNILSAPTNPTWHVSPSLEDQIYRSDVIVRASLFSAKASVETVPSDEAGVAPTYRAAHELRFVVHEYLKGSGPDNILVVARGRHTHLSEEDARKEADTSLALRNTSWDSQQGALFLREPYATYTPYVPSGAANTALTPTPTSKTFEFELFNPLQTEWDYTVDRLSRAWLPAKDASAGASSQAQSTVPDGAAFITGGSATINEENGSSTESTTLADLRTAIAEVATTLKAGEKIEGFDACIEGKILYERYQRATPWTPSKLAKTFDSGSAAGTEIYRSGGGHRHPAYSRFWVSGQDSDLFQTSIVDDDDPVNGYQRTLATARPLPSGVYRVRNNDQHYSDIPCNFVPEPRGPHGRDERSRLRRDGDTHAQLQLGYDGHSSHERGGAEDASDAQVKSYFVGIRALGLVGGFVHCELLRRVRRRPALDPAADSRFNCPE